MLSTAEIERRFSHHAPRTPRRVVEHEQVRAICRHAAEQLATVLPAGREAELAFTSLEETTMWANAAVARQPDDPE